MSGVAKSNLRAAAVVRCFGSSQAGKAGRGQVENGLDWGQHGVRRLPRSFFFLPGNGFLKFIFIGVLLLYNIVLVPAVQQRESAVHVYLSPLFSDFLPI